MTIGAILLGLALLIGVVAIVARPFWLPESVPVSKQMNREQELEAEKAVLLDKIKALDFDLETGKIPPSVHAAQRTLLVAEAAEILQELDELAGVQPDGVTMNDPELSDWEDAGAVGQADQAAIAAEIEAAIARIRETRSAPVMVAEEKVAEEKVAVAVAVPAGSGRFCSQCGQARDDDDKFCAYCGHRF